jgi:hypothetical protein
VECGTRPRLALDPVDLNRLWAVDQCSKAEAFRYSEDGGASFATVAVPDDPMKALSDVAVAPGTLIAVGDGSQILISRDGRTASRHQASNHYWRAGSSSQGSAPAGGGGGGGRAWSASREARCHSAGTGAPLGHGTAATRCHRPPPAAPGVDRGAACRGRVSLTFRTR